MRIVHICDLENCIGLDCHESPISRIGKKMQEHIRLCVSCIILLPVRMLLRILHLLLLKSCYFQNQCNDIIGINTEAYSVVNNRN